MEDLKKPEAKGLGRYGRAREERCQPGIHILLKVVSNCRTGRR